MPGVNHDWQDIDRYFAIHENSLEQVEEYFIVAHDVRHPTVLDRTQVQFRGTLKCLGHIEIHLNLWLDRDSSDRVRGRQFAYHAQISKPRVVNILRYDNAAHYPDHPDTFHKHLFDAVGKQVGIEHIGRQDFPTLRNVIDEVFEWWKAARDDTRYYP